MGNEKVVVLLSGGLDSTVLLHQIHENAEAVPLFVDYGQRWLAPERAAARAQCGLLGLRLEEVDASPVRDALDRNEDRRPPSPLPHRNLVLATIALAYAVSVRAESVVTAIIREDLGSYSCTLPSFWYALRDLAATIGSIRIEVPFIYLDKASVIAEGLRLGVDFTRTYTCQLGRERHCGICGQCLLRRRSAVRAGLVEPSDFYVHDTPLARRPQSLQPHRD
jgi:7-cyano-7-deazaguanine synthase